MVEQLSAEDWVTIVFGYGVDLTVDDLGGMRMDVAATALAAPTATVAGQDLYPDIHAKAAAMLSELLIRRPLGNEHLNREISTVTVL